MQNYEYLGKPLQIGRLTISNRFCMAPIGGGQHHLPGGGLKDETIQYLIERAKGGFYRGDRGRWYSMTHTPWLDRLSYRIRMRLR